jgi:LuxR family transcriptional regulator, maltose regulon positive regulatory protein
MIASVETSEGASAAASPVISPGASGLVARSGLFDLLRQPTRMTVVSAPPGSGKTVLLRSWVGQAALEDRCAWVAAGRDERDPLRFWLAVLSGLRRTVPASPLVRAVTAAPDLDGWLIVERLLKDLAPLRERVLLVVDDVHELGAEALRQLELLVMRAPAELRFVLATRHDVRMGLHRLRLDGQLTEIREPELRFTLAEARALFVAAGVELPESALVSLHQRTEGWAAGLRLAALSLAGHPDPERFAAEFSGTDRTVAEYLLAEVLDRQGDAVRRLLLRTSLLDRVNGELADLLTGDVGGERVLQDLEAAGAFVVSLDGARSWFRYHSMFAGLLQLELRRSSQGEVSRLHRAAAEWFEAHGYPVEAIRHAQAAGDWGLAAGLLADHWPGLYLDGQAAVTRALLAGFPVAARMADAQLAAVSAVDELTHGSVDSAERYLDLAQRDLASVAVSRREQAQLLLGIARLLLARQRGDVPAVAEEARRLDLIAGDRNASQPGLGEELRALALIGLESTEFWTGRFAEAEQRIEAGRALARRIGRPFLEFTSLAYQTASEFLTSFDRAVAHCEQAIELADEHGWADEHAAGVACMVLGGIRAWQGRLEEAEPLIQRAERTVRAEAQPIAGMALCFNRAALELGLGRNAEALAAFRAGERLAALLAASNPVTTGMRGFQLQTQVRLGEVGPVERELAGFAGDYHGCGELHIAEAELRLAQRDPHAAIGALAKVLDGSAPTIWPTWQTEAFLLEAIAQDAAGDQDAAGRALENALDRAEPDGALLPFLLHPVPGLLERHRRRRTAHGALIVGIQDLLSGRKPVDPAAGRRVLTDPLSESELRVLRYLPTNLTAPEIAGELSVSLNTVKTHVRNLYAKLGTHRRAEAVTRARDLGLLAPSALSRRGRLG